MRSHRTSVVPLKAVSPEPSGSGGAMPTPSAGVAGKRQAFMTVRGLRKTFDNAVVYDDFEIDLPLGQFISIFGPNGCGKAR